MPRAAKVLNECFVESDDKKKILCTICDRHGSKEWIGRDGDKKHISSKAHERNIDAERIRAAALAAIHTKNQAINSSLGRLEIPMIQNTVAQTAYVPSAEEERMWDDYHMHGGNFSAGNDPTVDEQAEATNLARQADQFGRWNSTSIARNLGFLPPEAEGPMFDEYDEDDALLCELMDNARIDDLVNGEVGQTRTKSIGEWYPYPSKMMFLLDTLDNLPRQRVSNSLMKVFLWILGEAGASDVPSLDALRKVQANLHTRGGVPTVPWTSSQGNIFHLNDIRVIIAKDYANPLTRNLLHFYPEIPDGPIAEAWHAQKWRRELDRDALTPMIVKGHSHFYVNELARLNDGSFVIPLCWVIFKGEMHADAYAVSVDAVGIAHVDDSTEVLICAAELRSNFYDLEFKKSLPVGWSDAKYPSEMPNPLRKLANGRKLYTSLVDLFFDDVSGNRSKSWNKHYNCYCTHRNLPRKILQQEFHTHFVTTSPHASSSEQFEGIKSLIIDKEEAAVRLFINTGPSDNPMGSEMTGHIGAKGNYFCRKCKVGGCGEHKRTDTGFHSMFEAGIPRTAAETLEELHKQVELACLGVKAAVEARQTDTGVKDAYTNHWIDDLLRRSRELKKGDPDLDSAEIVTQLMDWVKANESTIYNPFLSMPGFDAAKDTPIEILHTILLGIVKYAWHTTHTSWNAARKNTYTERLQATNTVGLSIPSIRASYIMQFANSLIGRQLKQVAQTGIFHMYDLTDGLQFAVWKAMGELLPLLWYPEIDDMDQYLADVENAVSNVLDLFAMLDPTKILAKNKLHILAHIRADVLRHGPLLGVITEGFESYNGVFRFCSIFSNHLAPSRDISRQLAHQEGLKHRLTGGWWLSETGEWEQAGWAVRDFLAERPILQALLGWTNPKEAEQGSVKLQPVKRLKGPPTPSRPDFKLMDTDAKTAINISSYGPETIWKRCINVVSKARDICPVSSWVYAISPVTNEPTLGRINDILTDGPSSIVLLDVFRVSDERHTIFNLPKLSRRQGEQTLLIVPSKDIQFIFNVQHDCYTAGCTASGTRPKMQERVASLVTESFVEHQPLEAFVINTTGFHNAHLLRQCLPRSAWAPVPLFVGEEPTAAAARAQKHRIRAEDDLDGAPPTKKRKVTTKKRKNRTAPKKKAGQATRKTKKVQPEESDGPEASDALDSEEETMSDAADLEGSSSSEEDESSEEEYVARPTRRPRGQQGGI
ncbi:hypothetical protein B0H11DRAFT_2161827 [Mycena galericulata]|nr:hypothetical protein B0H11DRAFT_2161827 [Mycena galericulata]